ncbi:hypothetical protein QR680_011124 [Steinernema hermaphroditum]|uniref:7TM GPCR serpentine receptor class x (Srx) domain-containing protein n=1 Tax=Steinernema hermaphroditum TaxID=289476 RepID=A0AA39IR66_9BILA|nr:hypothetical protein QR680_011124 [Steinernema hermaphroditum]
MNGSTFVYGSELQGRGYATERDLIFGYITTLISIVALFGAIINLYLIKNLKNFHNSFGFFWAVRTVGELGSNLTSGMYTGPVTILQPTNIPPALAIFAYQFSVTFGYVQCVMNLVIATNRFIAVCYPLRYKSIFNKTVCVSVALNVAMQGVLCISLYFIFPCNHIAYGPRFYSNVFIKCEPDLDRDYSIVSRYFYKVCFTTACFGTGLINSFTFFKIVYVRLASVSTYNTKEFKRDVRLFILGVVQDILMTVVAFSIILFHNDKEISVVGILLSYDGLNFIYAFNAASMIFCNPECRNYLFSRKKSNRMTVCPTNMNTTSHVAPSHSEK